MSIELRLVVWIQIEMVRYLEKKYRLIKMIQMQLLMLWLGIGNLKGDSFMDISCRKTCFIV